MKRLTLAVLTASAVLANANSAQALDCAPNNIDLESQADVVALGASGCDTVTGRLRIRNGADIVDLTPLSNLTSIGTTLQIRNLDNLATLEGLENLAGAVNGLDIRNNPDLQSLEGLNGITAAANTLRVSNNDQLASLHGLDGITSVGQDLLVLDNDNLSWLAGLEAITSVGRDLEVRNNPNLWRIDALYNVAGPVRDLVVRDNTTLHNLLGLEGVTSVTRNLDLRNNDLLASLAGLTSITSVGNNVRVQGHDELTSAEHLQGITGPVNLLRISGNSNLVQCGSLSELIAGATTVTINNNGASCDSAVDQEAVATLDYDAADADWATPASWDPVASPAVERIALIRNGGTSTESGVAIESATLVVGDTRTNGSGTLNISGQPVNVDGALRIGAQPGGYKAASTLSTNATVSIDGAPSIASAGNRATMVGVPTVLGSTSGTVNAELTITDAGSTDMDRLINGGMFAGFPSFDVEMFYWNQHQGDNYADSQLSTGSNMVIDDATSVYFGNEVFSGYIAPGASLPAAELSTTGNLRIENVTGTTEIDDDFIVGMTAGGIEEGGAFSGSATAEGTLVLNALGTVTIGEDLTTGKSESLYNLTGTTTARGTTTISNITTLDIDSDLKSGRVDSIQGTFSGEVNVFGDLTVTDVQTLMMGSDIEVSRLSHYHNDNDIATGVINSTGVAVVADIPTLDIGDDIEVGKIVGAAGDNDEIVAQATANSTGTLTLRNIPNLLIGTDSEYGEVDIGVIALGDYGVAVNETTATARGTVIMANVTAEVQDIVRVGAIDLDSSFDDDSLSPATNTTANAFGTLTLQGSSLTTQDLEVGVVAAGHQGNATGSLELNPSYISAENIVIGEGGRIVLNVDGLTRASADNLGSGGLHSAIDATNVTLAGEVVVSVNFVPPPGGPYKLNFLNAENITIDPSASVRIVGLPPFVTASAPAVVSAASGGRSDYQVTLTSTASGIPTLGAWQLALLALVIGGLGARLQRRR